MGYTAHSNLIFGIKLTPVQAKMVEAAIMSQAPTEKSLSSALITLNDGLITLQGNGADVRVDKLIGYNKNEWLINSYGYGVVVCQESRDITKYMAQGESTQMRLAWGDKALEFLKIAGIRAKKPRMILINQTHEIH